MIAKKTAQLAPTKNVRTQKLSKSVKVAPSHSLKRTVSLPVRCESPSVDDLLVSMSMNSLSFSKRALTKSRNRAMTATDFDSILCQL